MRIQVTTLREGVAHFVSSYGDGAGHWSSQRLLPESGKIFTIEFTLREPVMFGINARPAPTSETGIRMNDGGGVFIVLLIEFVDGEVAGGRIGPDATLMCEIDEDQAQLFHGYVEISTRPEHLWLYPLGG
jgi:hypothetical protein